MDAAFQVAGAWDSHSPRGGTDGPQDLTKTDSCRSLRPRSRRFVFMIDLPQTSEPDALVTLTEGEGSHGWGGEGEAVNWLQMTASEESGRMADLCCPKAHSCLLTTSSPCESAAPTHSPRSPFLRGCWSTDPCVWPDCKLCRTPAAG